MKNVILVVIAVVLIVVAVGVFAFRTDSRPEFTEFTTRGVDLVTHEELTVTYKLGQQAPYENPDTGQRTVYPWFFCTECRHRFVPELIPSTDGGPPRLPVIPTCPLCGSNRAGGWTPEFPEQAEPAGDAPLPELP